MFAFPNHPATVGGAPSLPTHPPGRWWMALALAGAAGLAASHWHGGQAAHRPADARGAAPVTAAAPPLAAHPRAPRATTLDPLRQATALGDVDASIALVGALLDRYDAGAGTPALFEALQWVQRDLDTIAMLASAPVQRIVRGPCRSDPLMQWHWLCNEGE